jgi:2-dehydropantoate 2-reductase
MLNGISHLARLDARLGAESVLGGAVVVAGTLDDDGTVRHTNTHQRIIFGERAHLPRESARTAAFAADLGRTKLDWVLSKDIEQDMWEKIVTLSALAAMTCLFRASIGEINSAPGGTAVMDRVRKANIAIATAEGHAPRPQAVEFSQKTLLDPANPLTASMLRDLEKGGAVESDHIIGYMLDRARAHGIDDTMLSIAMTHLKAYEARRAAGRL